MKLLKTITIVLIAMVALAFTSKLNPDKTISEMVTEKQELSTLLTALESAELVETLKGEGPYTVFAPSNEAFNKLSGDMTVEELLKPENKEKLSKILKYHVVSGEYYASDLKDGQKLESLEGTEIRISSARQMEEDYMEQDTTMMEQEEQQGETTSSDNGVKVNNAKVVEKDLVASNGIIHMIDAVINPADVRTLGSVDNK